MVCKIHHHPWKAQGMKNGDDGLDVPPKRKKRGLPEATPFINGFRCEFEVDEQPCRGSQMAGNEKNAGKKKHSGNSGKNVFSIIRGKN